MSYTPFMRSSRSAVSRPESPLRQGTRLYAEYALFTLPPAIIENTMHASRARINTR